MAKVIPETGLSLISTFLLLLLGRYLCWCTISPGGIIHPVVFASVLTWLKIYIFSRNLQFLNHVYSIKTKVLLPHTYVDLLDLECPVNLLRNTLYNLAFQYYDFECTR